MKRCWKTKPNSLRLTQFPDRLRLTITDDGRDIRGGADSHCFVTEGYLGLAGMRERAAMIGGRLEIQSPVDYGMVVTLEIPGGSELVSVITVSSVERLGLEVGKEAYAMIKASNVMIAVED